MCVLVCVHAWVFTPTCGRVCVWGGGCMRACMHVLWLCVQVLWPCVHVFFLGGQTDIFYFFIGMKINSCQETSFNVAHFSSITLPFIQFCRTVRCSYFGQLNALIMIKLDSSINSGKLCAYLTCIQWSDWLTETDTSTLVAHTLFRLCGRNLEIHIGRNVEKIEYA